MGPKSTWKSLEIESELNKIDFIKECCLIITSEEGSHPNIVAMLALVEKVGIKLSDVKRKIVNNLKSTVKINEVVIVDALPRLPSGKVDKISLLKTFNQNK